MNYLTKLPNAVFDTMEFMGTWLAVIWEADALPDADFLLRVAIIGAVWMGSAFLAATVAEMAGHGMFLHFCGGLVLPYIYPIALMFRLKRIERVEEQQVEIKAEIKKNAMTAKLRHISDEREAARRLRRGDTAAKPAEESDGDDNMPDFSRLNGVGAEEEADTAGEDASGKSSVASPAPREEPQTAAPHGLTRRYIESIAVDSTGNRAGPFAIKLNDGRMLTAISIRGIQDELAGFEIETANGPKSIRLRFDSIESCDRI